MGELRRDGDDDQRRLIELVLAVIPDAAVIVDLNGDIVAINEYAGKLFGYAEGELTGRSVETLIPERLRHGHRHERAGYSAAPRQRAMGVGLELAGRRRDGTEFPVDISLAPMTGYERHLVVAAIRDATERYAASAVQAELAAIVSSSLDAIVAMTGDGRITSWNEGATTLFGYRSDDIVGRHMSLLVPEAESAVVEELLAAVMAKHPGAPRDTVWRTHSGDGVDVAISVSPIRDGAGSLLGFSLLVRDVTERKRAERELRHQERWREAISAVRSAMLSDSPIVETLELLCDRTRALVGARSVGLVLCEAGSLRVVAAAGDFSDAESLDPPDDLRLALGLGSGASPPEVEARTRPVPATSGVGPRLIMPIELAASASTAALVMVGAPEDGLFRSGSEEVAKSMASQAALAMELAHARLDRERFLVSDDRERIARDLHDLVIQRLFGLGMGLQGVLPLIDHERAAARVATAVEELDVTIREIRTAIFALDRPPGSGAGLRTRVLSLATEAAASLGFDPAVRFSGPVDSAVTDDLAAQVGAVVSEALSNVTRHAGASRAEVDITASDDVLRVVVVDDGVGLRDGTRESGLANLRARAVSRHGEFGITSPTGGGTRVEWAVPLTR
ncbi:MAG: hypothetical protein NVSMB16_04390 [Acidimicrobiales bacterium]